MKTIYLLRHAKSSWDDLSLGDFERPLNKRGQEAAPLIGRYMRKNRIDPQLVVCSPARRAMQTARLALESANINASVQYERRIYQASGDELLAVLAELADSVDQALLIGHNPGLDDLIYTLSGVDSHMPTAALAKLSLEAKRWRDIGPGCGSLEWLIRPKELRGP